MLSGLNRFRGDKIPHPAVRRAATSVSAARRSLLDLCSNPAGHTATHLTRAKIDER